MSFGEELRERIRTAKAENEEEARAAREFDEQWERLRTGLVLDALQEAATVLNEEGVGGYATRNNGTEVVLEAKRASGTQRFDHKLKFAARKDSLEVVCSSSIEKDSDEPYTLENLTRKAVEDKVKEFVYSVLRQKQRSSGVGVINMSGLF